MDITVMRGKLTGWVRKYRYVLLVLMVGILLMLLPSREKKDSETVKPEQPEVCIESMEVTGSQLEDILSEIKGAGKVQVLLTCSAGERTVYQTDQRTTDSDNNSTMDCQTVLVTDSSRNEGAIITQILAPEYLGAVVVCQGADDPSVRLAVSEAVGKATGLGTNHISVLKMK